LFLKYHVRRIARRVAMAPKTAPPTTLPAMTPGLGLPLLAAISVTVAVVVRIVSLPAAPDEVVAAPRLPVSLGRPGHAAVIPPDVEYTLSLRRAGSFVLVQK
jgi:hypothetical protein